MAKFSCEIKKLLVLGADPSFLYKKKRVTQGIKWKSHYCVEIGM